MARRILAAATAFALLSAGTAGAAEPKLRTSAKKLAAAYHCPVPITGKKTPIMLVTGTGYTGDEAYAIGKPAFDKLGNPVCYVNFPFRTTADIQTSVEYLVYGIRRMEKKAGSKRKIAIFGVSQGGLLPRWALTYWPSLRSRVGDVIAVAGTQHGTNIGTCTAKAPCTPAVWQQKRGSRLLSAINHQPDETPGSAIGWTTVRSSTDEVVQPQVGTAPTSSLDGASNILIQNVCPTRKVTHIGTAIDSVTFAAFVDAITHKGPAQTIRLPSKVCDTPYAPGIGGPPAASSKVTAAADESKEAPLVKKEPVVRSYAKRIVK
jgi:hypothetical protein